MKNKYTNILCWTLVPVLLLIFICGCSNNPVQIKKQHGKVAKISVDLGYDPCKLRGKRTTVKVKCEWKIDDTFRIVKQKNEVTHVLEEPKRVYHKSTYDPNSDAERIYVSIVDG